MRLLKSKFSLRAKDRFQTQFALREERIFAQVVVPFVAPIFVAFAFVDGVASQKLSLWDCIAIRLAAVVLSAISYLLARSRAVYGLRFFLLLSPYLFAVQWIM